MIDTNSKTFNEIKDKEYRDLYIESQAKNGIAFQIRALRAARNLKQDALAELAETKQTAISRIENRAGGYPNVGTLLKLAKVFDVALVVRFEPIDRYLDWVDNLSPEDMAPLESEKLLAVMERKAASATGKKKAARSKQESAKTAAGQMSLFSPYTPEDWQEVKIRRDNVVHMEEYLSSHRTARINQKESLHVDFVPAVATR